MQQVTSYTPPKLDEYGHNVKGYNRSHRKENSLHKEYAFFVRQPVGPGNPNGLNIRAALTVRFYHPGSVCYCAFWFHFGTTTGHATGTAGGGGYDKTSAAFADALNRAGFKFSEGISARGESAIEAASKALVSFFGAECIHVHTAHG